MAGYGSIEQWMVHGLSGLARRTVENIERQDDCAKIL